MSSLSVGSNTSSNLSSPPTVSSSSSGASTQPVSFTGLASGVDTSQIISAIESFANQQLTALQNQGEGYANIQSAFSTLQSDLTTLQSASNQLSQSTNGAITALTATPSDTDVLSATAGTAAVPGNYSLTVDSLAQANQVASQGFADPNVTLQQGTMTIQVGSNSPFTVTLNNQNNTLQGLVTAINSAGGNVQASIINDGSSTPYRLLLTSTSPGAANTISVTNNLSAPAPASTRLRPPCNRPATRKSRSATARAR